jgi:hypothetical protein
VCYTLGTTLYARVYLWCEKLFLFFVDDGCFLCLLFVPLYFVRVFCCCYVATRSLVMFVSSALAEGALECDHNL